MKQMLWLGKTGTEHGSWVVMMLHKHKLKFWYNEVPDSSNFSMKLTIFTVLFLIQ